MAVQVMSFYDKNPDMISQRSIYSDVWDILNQQYGNPIAPDGNGSVFRGGNGETAVLVDRSTTTDLHELVLIDVPLEVRKRLEELLESNQK